MQKIIAAIGVLVLIGMNEIAVGAERAKASDGKNAAMNLTPEQRQKMASAHEKMAACLRSDKSFEDCHKEMKADDGCPMMEHGMGKGMKSHHGNEE